MHWRQGDAPLFISAAGSHVHAVGWGCGGARGGGAGPGPRASLRLLSLFAPSLPLTHSCSFLYPPTGFLSAQPAPSPRSLFPPTRSRTGLPLGQRGGERRAPAPGAPQSLPVPGIAAALPGRNASSGAGCGAVRGDGSCSCGTASEGGQGRGCGARGGCRTRCWDTRPPPAPPTPSCLYPPSLSAAPRPGPDPGASCEALRSRRREPGGAGGARAVPGGGRVGGEYGLGGAKGRLGTGIESSTAPRAAAGSPRSPPEGKEREMMPCPRSPLPMCLPALLTSPSRVSMVLIITVFLVCTSEPRWSGLVSVGRGTQG